MKVNEVTVGRKFNIGNYESKEIRLVISPEEDEINKEDWEGSVSLIIKKLDKLILNEK